MGLTHLSLVAGLVERLITILHSAQESGSENDLNMSSRVKGEGGGGECLTVFACVYM